MACRWTIPVEIDGQVMPIRCELPLHDSRTRRHANATHGLEWHEWSTGAKETPEPRFVSNQIPSKQGSTVLDRQTGRVVATFHRDAHPNDRAAAKLEAARLSDEHAEAERLARLRGL